MRPTLRPLLPLAAAALLLSGCAGDTLARHSEASSSEQQALDQLFASVDQPGHPGIAISVFRKGQPTLNGSYGLADIEQNTPMTPTTPIHVASVSKQFTVFAILLLERDGKLALDDDIHRYLPYLPDYGQPVTIRQLILHTSGIREHGALYVWAGHSLDDRESQAQSLNLLARQPQLNFEPGTHWEYSNGGYALLADIVARVSGQSLRAFTHERIFAPLGMNQTFFNDDLEQLVPGRASSYNRAKDGATWERDLLNYETVGSTNLITTTTDMSLWAANFADPIVGDATLIEKISHNGTLKDGTPIRYGYALQRTSVGGHTVVMHTGSDAGFRALFCYVPDADLGVMIAANHPVDRKALLRQILDIVLPVPTRVEVKYVAPNASTLDSIAGRYLMPQRYTLQLDVRDATLYRQPLDGEAVPARFTENGRFDFGGDDDDYYIAVTDDAGRVTAIDHVIPAWARTERYERIADQAPAPTAAGDYLGNYYNRDIDTTYSVRRVDSGLELYTLWSNAPLAMTPVLPDRFETPGWPQGIVIFERDADGAITGLRMSDGYGENDLPFHRIDGAPAIWTAP